jgi:C4-dicarboxylate transporter DctQ subunit
MKALLKNLDKVEIYIIVITLPLMLLFVFLSTVFRYFELGSLTWAEEASRYLMIWLAFAGISWGFKRNAHLGLSFVVDKFSEKNQKVIYFIRAALIILFGTVVSYYTFLLITTQIKNPQISPAMGIPIWWVYSSELFGSLMIIIRTLQMAFIEVKNKEE